MNCLITQTLQWAANKKREARPEVVARYLKMATTSPSTWLRSASACKLLRKGR